MKERVKKLKVVLLQKFGSLVGAGARVGVG